MITYKCLSLERERTYTQPSERDSSRMAVASSDFKLCVDDDNKELDTVLHLSFSSQLFHLCEC